MSQRYPDSLTPRMRRALEAALYASRVNRHQAMRGALTLAEHLALKDKDHKALQACERVTRECMEQKEKRR